MRFEFTTPSRILFGPGVVKDVGALAEKIGKRALLVTGKGAADPSLLQQLLTAKIVDYQLYEVSGEPTVQQIIDGTRLAREQNDEMVIGFGGGSAIDTAKAIAVMATNPGELTDYLDVIGTGRSISQPALPVIAIPTTSGTGAEVTRNAVLKSPEHRMKLSLRSPLMIPRIAVVDPEVTFSMPPAVTASTGMDALAQLIEPFVSSRHNPLTDAICREGMKNAASFLLKAYEHPNDMAAREAMSLASLFGGLALANAGLGAVHGFASPIGGMFSAPHGSICARLLAPVMEVNIRAISASKRDVGDFRVSPEELIARYHEIVRLITGREDATLDDGIAWLEQLCQAMNIPGLADYGITSHDIPGLVEKAAIASSMQTNPVKLDPSELTQILQSAL